LLKCILKETGRHLSENVLTIIWARRFDRYKRMDLILTDNRIFSLLKENKVQIIFAGKPHPDDGAMIARWNQILGLREEIPNLVILPRYELWLSGLLKAGADIWLNTPRRPHEACGTSGLSAALRLALNVAARDGVYPEFIEHGVNGFLFGTFHNMGDIPQQDRHDFESLYSVLLEAIEIFYSDKERWYEMVLAGKETVETKFSSERMVEDYFSQMYNL
jgi:starch phosphorylase